MFNHQNESHLSSFWGNIIHILTKSNSNPSSSLSHCDLENPTPCCCLSGCLSAINQQLYHTHCMRFNGWASVCGVCFSVSWISFFLYLGWERRNPSPQIVLQSCSGWRVSEFRVYSFFPKKGYVFSFEIKIARCTRPTHLSLLFFVCTMCVYIMALDLRSRGFRSRIFQNK